MDNKFKILGEEIIITSEMEKLIGLHSAYRSMAERYVLVIDKEYSSMFKCFEDFLVDNRLEELIKQCIRYAIEFTGKGLKKFNIEINTDNVYKITKYCDELTIFKVTNEFKNIENTLLDAKERTREIRELRKENAPQFEGFGFSISGAVKGAIKAEIANVGVNAMYSLANSLGNAKTEYQVKSAKEKIFNDSNTKESIKRILYNDFIGFYDIVRDIINDSLPISKRYGCYSSLDSDKANHLFEKITDVDAYIRGYKENINYLLQNSEQYTQQMAKKDYESFYKELDESNREQDIREILKAFPLNYEYFKLYFMYIEEIDKDIEAYACLCGFDITELINDRNELIIKKEQIKTKFANVNSILHEKMMNNKFYNLGLKSQNIKELINLIINNISATSIKNNVFTTKNEIGYQKRLNNITNSYAELERLEEVLVIFDNTAFRSAKDGFIITNKNIYAHNCMEMAIKIPLNEINEIMVNGADLEINNKYKIGINLIDKMQRQEFADFILYLSLELTK